MRATIPTLVAAATGMSALTMAAPHAAHDHQAQAQYSAPLIQARGANLVEGKYIVKMKPGRGFMDAAIANIASKADYTYKRLNGFAGSLTEEELAMLRANPMVEYIEQDATIHAYPFYSPPTTPPSSSSSSSSSSYPSSSSPNSNTETESDAPWGLARLSSDSPGSSSYTYDATAGSGTCAYILDTGIDTTHPEFQGRAIFLKNFADDHDGDGVGHGTHVAGTVGSASYGVAKKTTLFAVKVLGDNGSGTNAGVVAGMEYVVEDSPQRECPLGVVVNMSLGGSKSDSVNAAAKSITDSGIFLAVAAGNEASDAEGTSPASEESVCTVGATDVDDVLANYSNFGKMVDVLAPGTDILSTWPAGKTNTISGTSMATPHITGLGAYFLGMGGEGVVVKADGLCQFIVDKAQEDAIKGVPDGTANLIAQNGEA